MNKGVEFWEDQPKNFRQKSFGNFSLQNQKFPPNKTDKLSLVPFPFQTKLQLFLGTTRNWGLKYELEGRNMNWGSNPNHWEFSP